MTVPSDAPGTWPLDLPRRTEIRFGDRELTCFAMRPPSVDAMLSEAVERNAEAEAVVHGSRRITYAQLADRVARLAHGLDRAGIEPGDRVGIALGNRPEFLESVLAAARLGAISVPISVREQREGLAYVLGHCGAKALLFEASIADRIPDAHALPRVTIRIPVGEDSAPYEARLDGGALTRPWPRGEESVAAILYTSGTTGRPKGAMLTEINLVHSVLHYRMCLGLGEGERSVLAVPASHVTGLVANILAMLGVAGCTVLLPSFDAGGFLALARAERMTHTVMVPAMYTLCLMREDFDEHDLSCWRIGGYGGAPMPEALIEELSERLPRLELQNLYGATETTSPATAVPPGQTAAHPDSVGRVVPCGEIRAVDARGDDVPAGESGELWIKGPMVVPGYWEDRETTRSAFPRGWWRSGDIGSIDTDGWVRLHDRIKDVVNRGGYTVYSIEIENVVARCPGVIECAVVGQPDPVLGEKVHAFVHPREPAPSTSTIRAFCAERLAEYKVPDYVTFVAEPLPRNANGKVLKGELRERLPGLTWPPPV